MAQPALDHEREQSPSLSEKLDKEFPHGMRLVAANADISASSIAARFAPKIVTEAPETSAAPAAPSPGPDMASAAARDQMRGGAAILTAVAAVPAAILTGLLIYGVLLGQDMIGQDMIGPGQPASSYASSAGMPPIPSTPPKLAIALAAPQLIAAAPGEAVAFPLSLDSSDALPPRIILAIRNLPEGAQLSAGRPFGGSEWSLRPDEVAGLTLVLPDTEPGASDLAVELVAADGAVMARTATRLEVAPPPTAGLAVRSSETSRPDNTAGEGAQSADEGQTIAAEMPAGTPVLAAADPSITTRVSTQAGARAEPGPYISAPFAQPSTVGHPQRPAATDEESKPGPLQRLVAAAAGRSAADKWVESTSYVNMRNGPSSTAGTVKIAATGTTLRVLGRERNWVHVADPNTDQQGWIYTRFLKEAKAP